MSEERITRVRARREGEEKGPSLMAVAVARAGILEGGRAMAFLTIWMQAEASLGRPLGEGLRGHGRLTESMREYGAFAHDSERTSWRRLTSFRKAFPGEESPARLAQELRDVAALAPDAEHADAVATVALAPVVVR